MTEAKSARIFCLHIVKVVLVFLITRAENYKLHILGIHKLFKSHSYKVKSLMTYKSCYHTNHWYIPALFKAKTLLKCSLTLTLAAHIVLRVVTIDLIVCFRIIAFGINTIFNTAKFIVTEVKFVVKSPAEPWVFNFSRIAWRYC